MVPLPPTVLVLASGRGRRFAASGGAGNKLDALLHGKPVDLQHAFQAASKGQPRRAAFGGCGLERG